ncbi:MAG TPA: WYL domain-containing protein, partial [Coriobacteriia bacterium]|nr:WYL domain-containing protein [Coriobacteriia bacterium]
PVSEAVERLVNLALFLAAARQPLSAERIRAELTGYPEGQDEAAFIRMFERDKDDLRAMGLAIESTPEGEYQLDPARTFVSGLELTPEEETALTVIASVFIDDPSFPYASDLRFALAKVGSASDGDVPAVAHLADERPATQAAAVATLTAAAMSQKRATFDYTNARGARAVHAVEPYGLFLRAGRWYLVARDIERAEIRVYAVARMGPPSVNATRPRTPDFELPDDFDVGAFIGHPFQYGTGDLFDAVIRFSPSVAFRAPVLTGGTGELRADADGLAWHVAARDESRLARWVVANGPGIAIESPSAASALLRDGLARAEARHA